MFPVDPKARLAGNGDAARTIAIATTATSADSSRPAERERENPKEREERIKPERNNCDPKHAEKEESERAHTLAAVLVCVERLTIVA